ncbi:MAG: ROK family protein [Gammaproteobacteria bacterium]|nr:ROK family protein [Gammaproteobacteria bacterium]
MGGTKIEGIVLDDTDRELVRRRIATPVGDYEATVRAVANLVRSLEEATGSRGTVGIGHPGAISPATGLVKNANSVVLNGSPLDEDLSTALGRPVRLANDADCFTLSEATDGAAASADVVFGAILGTGVGGGIVFHGALLSGPNGIAGEWGHNSLPWPRPDEVPGPACYCGLHGCVETYLSGPAMERDYSGGRELSSREIVQRIETGEDRAIAVVDRYVDRLARALAVVINIVDPTVIVLGGGMSNVDVLYERIPQIWDRHVFSDRVDTRLVKALHGDSSGVRGAARLWP